MRRHSVELPPKKQGGKKAEKKHVFSDLLKTDHRVASAPRHVEVVRQYASPEGEVLYCAKIYAVLDSPGSELLTISRVAGEKQVELEMRFDEKFPVSIRFRKQTDEERMSYVRDELKKDTDENLSGIFRAVFPKFGI